MLGCRVWRSKTREHHAVHLKCHPHLPCLLFRLQVKDLTGNPAQTLFRFVYVVCPAGEDICPGLTTDDGRPVCSFNGACGVSVTTTQAVVASPRECCTVWKTGAGSMPV
jgi:hypothetical protein